MIGARAARRRRQRRSTAVRQLIRVQVSDEAAANARLEDRAAFVGSERALLAKRVHAVRELVGCRLGQELLEHRFDPRARLHPGRDRVQGEQGGNDVAGSPVRRLANELQEAQFALDAQGVTRLHFRRRDSGPRQPSQALARRQHQVLVRRFARRLDRGDDPAARLPDLRVGRSREALRELVRAVAGEEEM